MANPFSSSTTINTAVVTPTSTTPTSSLKLSYTNSPIVNTKLSTGELLYNYYNNILYLGAYNASDPNIKLIDFNNTFVRFLTPEINENISDKVPTSRAVRLELNKKADLTHSNQFTGMNEFPYLRILDAAPAQQNIAVTIRMLKDYIEGTEGVIKKLIEDYAPSGSTKSVYKEYKFPIPILDWTISHSENTEFFSTNIIDSNGQQHDAPLEIINKNNFIIHFNNPVSGILQVTYYV